ncbi:hypothetical protein [Tenacibaculum xiamenense]|uniref:hypothetical protein n=1 Tax=Tenacibaculum xiamenense TaxID=1261553 RepID=UPI003894EA5B
MNYYSAEQSITMTGVFVGYVNGNYVFHMENDDVIDFERINKEVLEIYNLKDGTLKNKKFEVGYTELYDDLDDEDYVIFRLDKLNELS